VTRRRAALAAVAAVLGAVVLALAVPNRGIDGGPLRMSAAAEGVIPPPIVASGSVARRRLERAADSAARELIGSGDRSWVSWDASDGLWDKTYPRKSTSFPLPMWWQSALAMRALVRYATAIRSRNPAYRSLLASVYRLDISRPGTLQPYNFENRFMDDTAWWALAWVDAARYELGIGHDRAAGRRYLALAELDASYIAQQPKTCGGQGIEFERGYTPSTITNEEFVSLAAELAQVHSPHGAAPDPALHRRWLSAALGVLGWLRRAGLVNLSDGTTRATMSGYCTPAGGPMTYTEGEMADGLTQLGLATGQRFYLQAATRFLHWLLVPSHDMLAGDVLQEPCEAGPRACVDRSGNITVFKGIVVDALADWTLAAHAPTYGAVVAAQARAILAHAGATGGPGVCATPSACVLSMYWAQRPSGGRRLVSPTPGSQTAGLSALTDALAIGGLDRPAATAAREPSR